MVRRDWKGARILALLFGVVLAFGMAGCGSTGDNGQGDGGDGSHQDGCVGGGVKALNVVGDPNRILHPGDKTDLQVVLLAKCVGAVAGEQVAFEINSNPGDSTLSAPSVATAASGVASVTLTIGTKTGSFMVHATHPEVADGVYFSIKVQAVRRQLTANPTTLDAYTGESVDLQVTLTDLDTNNPVRGVDIAFAIVKPAPGNASIPTPVATTNVSGLAKTSFMAGDDVVTYNVTAQGSKDQVGSVTFTINVLQRQACSSSSGCPQGYTCVNGSCHQNGGTACTSDDQCPNGYQCLNNVCKPKGGLPETCATDDDCPTGYYCESHQCYPCDQCAAPCSNHPKCTGPCTGCQTDNDCPPSFKCHSCVCLPDNNPSTPIPDLGGTWYTKHYFNIGEALGGAGSTLNTAITLINKAINYCDITGIGMIDDLICQVIHQYVPDWVGTLVDILANLMSILSELRSEGEMTLTHLNPRELVSGTETWTKILIRYLDACCDGVGQACTSNSDCDSHSRCLNAACCNPYNKPNFPDCATIDINRDDPGFGDVGLTVDPFTGKIKADTSGAVPKYTLMIDPRQVQIEYSKFVLYIVNLLISIFTDYDNLDDALQAIIDCQAIAGSVEDFCNSIGLPFVNCGSVANSAENACNNIKPHAGDIIGGLLNQISVDWSLLKFTGWATITTDGDPPYGIQLGFPNYETGNDGKWDGTMTIVVQGNVTGAWYGTR